VHFLVTGAAGFVGSTMVDRLLRDGHTVAGVDNLSTGVEAFLTSARTNPGFRFIEADLLDPAVSIAAAKGADAVLHFAANADVRHGTEHPRKDLEQNVIVTTNLLEAARVNGVPRFAFSSTGSVYGDAAVIPTPENAPFPIQTSLYGASKVSAESFIQAYAEGFGLKAYIFRFVSLLGERYTHGHVVDFYNQLVEHPDALHVLGDGHQRKSYLYIGDCIDAVLTALKNDGAPVQIYNLGTDEYCEVNASIGWICDAMKVRPMITYGGGTRGWIGDNPFIFLECSAMRGLGWRPTLTIRESVERTVGYLDSLR
jgi:UDP-glucose 4-epimerase